MENVLPLFSNPFLLGLFAIVTGFGLAYKILPVIIFLAHKKNLMDEPKKRSAHLKKLPNLGGVGIFIAITISITVFGSLIELVLPQFKQLLVLFGAITILFFLGLKDDLTGLSYIKKFGGQTIAACLVVLLTDIRISNFGGLFGIYELPYFISVLFSILLFVYLINAFNLIDGIDGLAGSIAIVSCSIFGLFFLLNGHALLALVSLSMIGALVGFLKYNLSKSPKKLFMGDSGSLFIGFLLCYQAIAFINAPSIEAISVSNKLIIALAVLSIPTLDTLRIFIIRIAHRRSPFTADRNHIHHRLLDLGLTHKQATLLLIAVNLLIITVALLVGGLNINYQFLIVISFVPIICLFPYFIARQGSQFKFVLPTL